VVVYSCNPYLARLRQEDHKFEASLGCRVIPVSEWEGGSVYVNERKYAVYVQDLQLICSLNRLWVCYIVRICL
jgi:hypothetical protein